MNLLIGVILGVMLFYSLGDPILNKVTIQQVAVQSPAAEAGLQAGDLILAVNGEPIDSTQKLQKLIEANLGKPTTVVLQRGNQTITVILTPRVSPPTNQGAVGIVLGHPTQPIGIGAAISRGTGAAYDYGRSVLLLPINMLRGQVTPQEGRPVGFKGMFDIYQQIQSPIFFFMVISISLGIFNLFPIPALDGGRILLTLPEIIVRRRIPPHYENMIHLVGFTLLLILIIYINVQDFINPLQLPR
jgi:regulator of sigma E protease